MWNILLILSAIIVTAAAAPKYQTVEVEDKDYWLSMASSRLDEVLKRQQKNTAAKNVIIFVGDGMGVTTVTAGRIFQGQRMQQQGENNILSFEKFPVTGLSKDFAEEKVTGKILRPWLERQFTNDCLRISVVDLDKAWPTKMDLRTILIIHNPWSERTTYNFDTQVPDSASTATALFSGVKTRINTLGLDSIAAYNVCNTETNKKALVTTIMDWAQKKGKDTGIVTTTRITHATPAATYAHINNRDWECDSKIPKQDVGCVKDIARQLVEDEPGKNFKVILGGGRNQLGDSSVQASDMSCTRQDGRNLVTEWKNSKGNSKYVKTAEDLQKINIKKTDYLLGLFAAGHMNYSIEKEPTQPSLKLMTETAIRMLQKNSEGFILMVEGGRIDHGHHNNTPELALSELVDFDEAVNAAVTITNPDETLIIVTADHSHAMTMNGYPPRGNNILGLAINTSGLFFETLTYANGPGFKYHHLKKKEDNCKANCSEDIKESANVWRDIRNDTNRINNPYYQHLSALYLPDETHGGEDVAIYATGPMSHLLSGVHEQNYIATVISYAACIGPESHRCTHHKISSSAIHSVNNVLLSIFGSLIVVVLSL